GGIWRHVRQRLPKGVRVYRRAGLSERPLGAQLLKIVLVLEERRRDGILEDAVEVDAGAHLRDRRSFPTEVVRQSESWTEVVVVGTKVQTMVFREPFGVVAEAVVDRHAGAGRPGILQVGRRIRVVPIDARVAERLAVRRVLPAQVAGE